MARTSYKLPSYQTEFVFAAACAAYRVNNGYFKASSVNDDAGTSTLANKVLTRNFLEGIFDVREEDHVLAAKVMEYCRSLTFKILTNKPLNEFEQNMLELVDRETVSTNYEIAVIASLPSIYDRSEAKRAINARLRDASIRVGEVEEHITFSGEVVKCFLSQQWSTHFITVITDNNEKVFFAYRSRLEIGDKINAEGKVKAHRDEATQLNYVKVFK